MDELPAFISLLAAILSVAGLLGGALGFFKAKRGEAIISLQGIEINALKQRNETLSAQFDGCKDRLKTAELTVMNLADQVQGAGALKALVEQSSKHYVEVLQRLDRLQKDMEETS